ncbi:MAG: hypothetical protein NTZ93_04280 [Candidatus Beckwithbacteria bacterium]|nr:hypothetical protein [Candidatus Beckwithbacteria bacterium]
MALSTPLPAISGFGSGFFQSAGDNASGRTALIISNIIAVLTIFGGLAFLFWFIIGALTWINSGGDPKQLDKAKDQMGAAIIGLVVLVLTYAIVSLLGRLTGLNVLDFETLVNRLKP